MFKIIKKLSAMTLLSLVVVFSFLPLSVSAQVVNDCELLCNSICNDSLYCGLEGTDIISCEGDCNSTCQDGLSMEEDINDEFYGICQEVREIDEAAQAAAAPVEETEREFLEPALIVPIPGFSFTDTFELTDESFTFNFVGEYVSAIYNYAIGIGVIVATIMLMWGGVRWILGSTIGDIADAKKIIGRALLGMGILASSYFILFIISPSLTVFGNIALITPNPIDFQLNINTYGPEGGGTTMTNLVEPFKSLVAEAQTKGECPMPTERIGSPTGKAPNQGTNYHWYKSDRTTLNNWKKIYAFDYSSSLGNPVYAPFSGTATYEEGVAGVKSGCGNTIWFEGQNIKLRICHLKDFVDENGNYQNPRIVTKGEVIGHSGGVCCEGTTTRSAGWSTSTNGYECTGSRSSVCVDPKTAGDCTCQEGHHAGNTEGPHVHMGYLSSNEGFFLSCLE